MITEKGVVTKESLIIIMFLLFLKKILLTNFYSFVCFYLVFLIFVGMGFIRSNFYLIINISI